MGRAFEFRKARKMKRWGNMAKTFTRLSKQIAIAVKAGGPDIETNANLRSIIATCKRENMPKDNIERAIKNAMGKVGKLRMIWAMFKLYLNNPNYYVRQDDVLADLFMQGEYDVERFCHSLGVTPQRGLTFGQLLKQCNIL